MNLVGQKFGRWTVVERETNRSRPYWRCECECGESRAVSQQSLLRGLSASCGCFRSEKAKQKLIDMIGLRFGSLVVISRSSHRSGKHVTWECACDCGNKSVVSGTKLRSGHTKSCGCAKVAEIVKRSLTHGKCMTPEYRVWTGIKSRCFGKKTRSYKDYGGRGVTMCKKWRDSFEAFYDDMGPRPSPDHSIERLDNDGNYEPGNCVWATRCIQCRNKRNNVVVRFQGSEVLLMELCENLGLRHSLIRRRLYSGWNLDRALSTPDRKKK